MRPYFYFVALISLASVVLLASCGGMGGMQRMHPPDGVEGSLDEMSVAEFYQANCAGCHGGNRQGGVGPSLAPSRLIESDDYYFDAIANGREGTAMPSWSELGLTDADISDLVKFLRTEP
jgi:mono/diheme cytochrome c family protein